MKDSIKNSLNGCSLSTMRDQLLADLARFDSWRSGPPEEPENAPVEFETPQIVRLITNPSPYRIARQAWLRLIAMGLVKGRFFTPPDKLPREIRDALDFIAICGEYLALDISPNEAELALRYDWVTEPPTDHEKQWLANCMASCQEIAGQAEEDLTG